MGKLRRLKKFPDQYGAGAAEEVIDEIIEDVEEVEEIQNEESNNVTESVTTNTDAKNTNDSFVINNTLPTLKLTSNPADVIGKLREYELILGDETLHQIEYIVEVNGVKLTFDLNSLPTKINKGILELLITVSGNLGVVFLIIWFVSGRLVIPLKKLTLFTQEITKSGAISEGKEITGALSLSCFFLDEFELTSTFSFSKVFKSFILLYQ